MANVKKLIPLVALICALFLTACSEKPSPDTLMQGKTLSDIQDDNKEKEKYLVVDVRSKKEYDEGHIKHSINIPLDDVEKSPILANFKDKNIILYCNTGNKSQKAKDILVKNGFSKVFNAQGVKDYKYKLYTYTNVLADTLQKTADENSALIIDTRAKKDYEKGHLQNAINIPAGSNIDEFKDVLEPYKDKEIITHCYSGNKSSELANELVSRGFSKVTNSLDGTKEHDFKLVK